MKTKEFEKLRARDIPELQDELNKAREELRSLRFDLESGKVKNSAVVRETRKEIARLLTLINEKKNTVKDEKQQHG